MSGDYKTFHKNFFKPIRKSIQRNKLVEDRLHSKVDPSPSHSAVPSLFSQAALSVTADGLQVLHVLHKQVRAMVYPRRLRGYNEFAPTIHSNIIWDDMKERLDNYAPHVLLLM